MTAKDLAALRTEIATELPDNVIQAISAQDVRDNITDLLDSLGAGVSGPVSHSTLQSNFSPPAAVHGRWRYVRNRFFQAGLTMTSQDFVVFENCRFDGPVTLTTCDNVRFINCTSDDVTGTFLTATSCDRLRIDGLTCSDASSEGISLTSCTRFRLVDVYVDDASHSAAAYTFQTHRNAIFDNTSNLVGFNAVSCAIRLASCTNGVLDGVRFNACQRTGLYVKQCTDITVRDIETEGGHVFTNNVGVAINDDPIIIEDSKHVVISGGQILNSGRHAVYVHESPPATPASGLGQLTNNILIEKLRIQQNTTDSRADTTGSYGIFINGGSDVTLAYNDVSLCGETGIECGPFGCDRLHLIGNKSHKNGQNATLVHWDGFSYQAGTGLVLLANTFIDNYRSGMQLKPGYLSPGTSGFTQEYPLQDAVISHNFMVNNSRAGAGVGYGINILDAGAGRQYVDRVTISSNVLYQNNDSDNLFFTTGTANVQLVGNHFGESGANANIRWQDSYNVSILGGFVHSKATTGQNFGLRASGNIGPSSLTHIVGVDFRGVDVSALNRRNTSLAVTNATDPLTDTLADALAAASTAEGRDIRLYNFFDVTTGGSSTVRDISEIQAADKADYNIRSDGSAPIYCFGNRSSLVVSSDVWVDDRFSVRPAQSLTSIKPINDGVTWTAGDFIEVANGFGAILGFQGDDAARLNKVELMCLRGWSCVNTLPSTADHPIVQAIADNDIEAFAPLEVAPT